MLTNLDAELFPDDCEVVEIAPRNLYVYLIQKNASSSLRLEAKAQDWRILTNHDLGSLDSVDVYLRDPLDRYLSGVNTFVQHLMRDQPDLDRHTCEMFATRYGFINRHYLPQWHWLLNLARFIGPHCQLRLHAVEDLTQITQRRSRANIHPLDPDRAMALLPTDSKIEFWFLLDRILLGRCGQSLTWKEILHIYQTHPAQPLQIVLERMKAVWHVLH